MILKIDKYSFIIFDLDDTLYKELDFLKSAFKEISMAISQSEANFIYKSMYSEFHKGNKDVFGWLLNKFNLKKIRKNDLIRTYQEHYPKISLPNHVKKFIFAIYNQNIKLGIITDGRSITQRNKIKALFPQNIFSDIIISEEFGSSKPNQNNYIYFEKKYPDFNFTYVADNTNKDFITPNKRNWDSICLIDNGNNIHKQDFNKPSKFLPKTKVHNFDEIIIHEK